MTVGSKTVRVVLALSALALAAAGPAAAQSVIKLGTPTIRESNHEFLNMFKERFEKRAPAGQYRVEVYPAGQLGSIPRTIEGVQLGTIEAAFNLPEFLVGVDKRFGLISAPGLFEDLAHGYRTYQDPEFRRSFWTIGEPKGFKVIAVYCPNDAAYAFRDEAGSLDDIRGRKIRTFPSPMEREILGRYGASVTPMSLEEVVPSLQQRVIDGAKAAMTVHVAFKFYSVARHAVRTAENLICPMLMASKAWYDKLPADVRKIVDEESQATSDAIQPLAQQWNEDAYANWTKNGGALSTPTAAQRADMMRKLATVADEAVKGDPAQEAMLATIKRAAQRNRK